MIGIFVNPLAGKGKALQTAAQLEKILMEKEAAFAVHTHDWPDNLQQYTQAWIVGGDGTLNYFLNQYQNINIPLAIFKGGTGNDFAWQLYGNITTAEQAARVLQVTPKPVDAAICNDKIFINSVGIGFDGEVLQSMGAIRNLGGHLGYLWVVIKKIFSFTEFPFTIRYDGEIINNKFLLVNIANASRTGGGFKISPRAVVDDGKLNLVLCRPLSVLKRLRFLPVIEKGKHLHLPFIQHRQVESITVSGSQSLFAQLDGELVQSTHFAIKILPRHFLFKF